MSGVRKIIGDLMREIQDSRGRRAWVPAIRRVAILAVMLSDRVTVRMITRARPTKNRFTLNTVVEGI
jgi:hypothetical protein